MLFKVFKSIFKGKSKRIYQSEIKNKGYWLTIENIGDVYVKKFLLNYNFIQLFLAYIPDKKLDMICITLEVDPKYFLITYISQSDIDKLLNREIDITSLFKNDNVYKIYNYNKSKIVKFKQNINDFIEDGFYLPIEHMPNR